eukprot:14486811-Alexandrium_andersonii.AAC.1
MCIRDSLPEAPLARPPANFVGRFGTCAKQRRRMHPSRALGTSFEVVSGDVQFKFRFGSAGGLLYRFDRLDSLL